MDRITPHRPPERQYSLHSQPSTPSTYPPPFQTPTAQPPTQIPHSDPFQTNKDPFLFGSQHHRGGLGLSARAWPPTPGNGLSNGHDQRTPPQQHQQQSHPLPPPPPPNGIAQMSLPYDPSRRSSLGGVGSPRQYPQGPLEPPPPPQASLQARQMPPPSPTQLPSAVSSLPSYAPRGPNASPFAGVRDLASFSSHRPAGGMSISSILGGGEEKRSHGSPHNSIAATSPPKSMPPPSPGRARSISMREPHARAYRDMTPPEHILGLPRPASSTAGHDRITSEPRKERVLQSPQFHRETLNNFRAFQPPLLEGRLGLNGHGPPGRPSSQPNEQAAPRSVEEMPWGDAHENRFGVFRPFPEANAPPERREMAPRHEADPFQNGHAPPPQPSERLLYRSPQLDRNRIQQNPFRFQHGNFGAPIQDEQPPLARPPFLPGPDPIRESIESRSLRDMRYDAPRSSPPLSDFGFERSRNGFIDRPMTFEEHQRLEAIHREEQQRKESDGSGYRSVFNISPELNRKGRNSPLPQAVQGAQPRHVGPGGDNPGIKMEFGRMFSGLGSGVGTATPTAGQSVNGTTTPSRLSPPRYLEGGDLVRSAVAEIEEGSRSGKNGTRGGKRNSRRHKEEDGVNGNGRDTPDMQRGNKRSKNNHHHHHHVHPHHHHHHHETVDSGPSPFNLLRFPSNPLSQQNLNANSSHHHHHHHAHPGHHHHHPPRSIPPPRKPTTTVMSRRLVEECAKKPRKHLGSQLYTSEVSRHTSISGITKISADMKPIPYFEGKENCTYTVRVPRWQLASNEGGGASYLEEICKRRQLWGANVYTDDSDVVAAAVHSGWMKGDFGEHNDALHEVCGNDSEIEDDDHDTSSMSLAIRPRKPVRTPPDHEAHITLLILPPLEAYASTNQHHIWSRDWKGTHDGMSFMIERIEFVDEGSASRTVERSAAGRKQRLKVEDAKRREAAADLLLFANGGGEVVQAAA